MHFRFCPIPGLKPPDFRLKITQIHTSHREGESEGGSEGGRGRGRGGEGGGEVEGRGKGGEGLIGSSKSSWLLKVTVGRGLVE